MSDRQQELREKGAEFIEARAALARAAQYPVVAASRIEQARLKALNTRAAKLQALIEQVGKMIDGARHWFHDTFSMDLQDDVPVANTVIDSAIQAAIAGMNYFLRDVRKELDTISKAQAVLDAAPEDQKKKIIGELQALGETSHPPVISKKAGIIVVAVLGLLLWFGSDENTIDQAN